MYHATLLFQNTFDSIFLELCFVQQVTSAQTVTIPVVPIMNVLDHAALAAVVENVSRLKVPKVEFREVGWNALLKKIIILIVSV
jgi:hypothetical protein